MTTHKLKNDNCCDKLHLTESNMKKNTIFIRVFKILLHKLKKSVLLTTFFVFLWKLSKSLLHIQDFIAELKQHTNHTWQLKPELVEPLQSLWAHPAIKKAFENRAKMDINDNAEYFIKDLGRLCAAS